LKRRESGIKPLLALFGHHWKGMGLAMVLALATIGAGIGLLGLAGWFIAAAAFAGLNVMTAPLFNLFLPSVGVRLFAIIRTTARYAERIVSHETTFRLLESLRDWFYRKLEPLAPARLMEYRSGDILNRIVADIDALDNLYLRVISPTIVAVIISVLVLIFIGLFHPGIALLIWLTLFAGGFLVSAAALKAGSKIGVHLSRQTTDLRISIIDGLQGMSELLVFGAHGDHLTQIRHKDRDLLRSQLRMSQIKAVAHGIMTLLAGGAVVGTLVIGIGLVHQGHLDGSYLAMMVLVVLATTEAILPLPLAYQFLGHTREAARRLQEVVATDPQVDFLPESQKIPKNFGIQFDGLTFSYRRGAPAALKDFDLHIEDGERVAIVGQTGAGKSTLANLLVRFWDPQEGCIRIGGVDIRDFSEKDLRRYLAVVTQQAHMFNASLRDNLTLADSRAEEEALQSALKAACMWEFVQSLPQGLDTWIGEAGRNLSSGQAQRVALARAIIKDAPIWILDEPTEGLDRVTEHSVMDSLLAQTRNRTLLLITHRLISLDQMDRIVVIEKGRILEQGSHRELLTKPSRYAELVGRINTIETGRY
jgi:ATP-binding cassette subfamily C protein CydC